MVMYTHVSVVLTDLATVAVRWAIGVGVLEEVLEGSAKISIQYVSIHAHICICVTSKHLNIYLMLIYIYIDAQAQGSSG